MGCCPTCGQDVPDSGPVVDLNSNLVRHAGQVVKLTTREAELLHVLAKLAPAVVPSERLLASVWGAFDDIGANNLTVQIFRLRRKLAPLGLRIQSAWGRGYALHDQQRTPA